MFRYLISIQPLGFMYGSAGAFLSPENLVGKSGQKFLPEAATLSGLFFSINKVTKKYDHEELRNNLYVAGPFSAKIDKLPDFYVPIPKSQIIGDESESEWIINSLGEWEINPKEQDKKKTSYRWQPISTWGQNIQTLKSNKSMKNDPWKYLSLLHPHMKDDERHVLSENGLFLETAVQVPDDITLIYLSTHEIENNWYRFGGENHLVEIKTIPLDKKQQQIFNRPIERTFALITSGIWGSNNLSYRYPRSDNFPKPIKMITEKAAIYRYRAKGQLGRGRYAVPSGSIYILPESINQPWSQWPIDWFPKEGYTLKHLGCGLALPIDIAGLNNIKESTNVQ